jgi:hypothetical protein
MSASTAPAPSRQDEQRIDRLSPDALMENFSRGRMLRWFLVALAAHVVVIGGLSLGTIADLLDPEAAAARKAAAKAAATPAAAPAGDAAIPSATEGSAAPPAAQPAAKEMTPIEKATTEVAKPQELPGTPDDLGIDLDDTNPN